jgi:hypothetical protein
LIREDELFGNLQAEDQPVEDFLAPGEQLDRLRALGIRAAVDDVGWPRPSLGDIETHVAEPSAVA